MQVSFTVIKIEGNDFLVNDCLIQESLLDTGLTAFIMQLYRL